MAAFLAGGGQDPEQELDLPRLIDRLARP